MFIIIVFLLGIVIRRRAYLYFLLTHASLLTVFVMVSLCYYIPAALMRYRLPYRMVPSFFAKRHDRNGGRVACQKLTIMMIIS